MAIFLLAIIARVGLALGADVVIMARVALALGADMTKGASVDEIWQRAAAVSVAELVLVLCVAGHSAELANAPRLHVCMRAAKGPVP